MKTYTHLLLAVASVFSFNCIAQLKTGSSEGNSGSSIVMTAKNVKDERKVLSYRVEEKINMPFGGSTTTYNVSHLSLVNTNDLGPNNTRVVTPKYAIIRASGLDNELSNAPTAVTKAPIEPKKVTFIERDSKLKSASIDVIDTYERVLEKGYKSIEMLKKVADRCFFEGELPLAAKWYAQLFDMTTDLESVYYYRYAESLKSVNELEKSKAMMAVFENRN